MWKVLRILLLYRYKNVPERLRKPPVGSAKPLARSIEVDWIRNGSIASMRLIFVVGYNAMIEIRLISLVHWLMPMSDGPLVASPPQVTGLVPTSYVPTTRTSVSSDVSAS